MYRPPEQGSVSVGAVGVKPSGLDDMVGAIGSVRSALVMLGIRAKVHLACRR